MATPRSYGLIGDTLPKGMLCRVEFPELMRLDERTFDGRLFDSAGFGVMEQMMPFPIKYRPETKEGHDDALLAGRIDRIEVHESGLVSGSGWALADEDGIGRRMAFAVATKACRTNSADLRDCVMKIKMPDWETMFEEDENGFMSLPRPLMNFPQSKFAGTTIVSMPAFATAYAEIDESVLERELVASFENYDFQVSGLELTASGEAVSVPHEDFFIPEADRYTKVIVDGAGRIYGHLGTWDEPHMSMAGERYIPRSPSEYAYFNKPGVLTDGGLVSTGPVFLLGGHPKNMTPEIINKAYGDIENTWGDVRLSNGRLGPWISGRVRPGTDPDKVYAARASRISGHWLGEELYAIVSVNVEGFHVPANPDIEVDAGNGRKLALVASFEMGTEAPSDDAVRQALAGILLADLADDDALA